jgi:hypothetical protein
LLDLCGTLRISSPRRSRRTTLDPWEEPLLQYIHCPTQAVGAKFDKNSEMYRGTLVMHIFAYLWVYFSAMTVNIPSAATAVSLMCPTILTEVSCSLPLLHHALCSFSAFPVLCVLNMHSDFQECNPHV